MTASEITVVVAGDRCPAVLGASAGVLDWIRALGFHACGLANNHIYDHGEPGLDSTLTACRAAGLATFGAGRTPAEAGAPLVVERSGVRLAFWGLAESQFSAVTRHSGGASLLSLPDNLRTLRRLRPTVDHIILLLHGGAEGYSLPSPGMVNVCRLLIEEGVSVVACQHSHCVGAYEEYAGGLILYGQGNFLFANAAPHAGADTGLLLKLMLNRSRAFRYELIPFRQRQDGFGLRVLTAEERTGFLDALDALCRKLASPETIEDEWAGFCERYRWYYLGYTLGIGGWLKRLLARGYWRLSRQQQRRWLQMVEFLRCDTHREALTTLAHLDFGDVGRSGRKRL